MDSLGVVWDYLGNFWWGWLALAGLFVVGSSKTSQLYSAVSSRIQSTCHHWLPLAKVSGYLQSYLPVLFRINPYNATKSNQRQASPSW